MKFVAIDIETTGLYPSPLITSGLYTGRPNKIFCLTINTGASIQLVEDMQKVKPILEDKTICKVIHNAQFDSCPSQVDGYYGFSMHLVTESF